MTESMTRARLAMLGPDEAAAAWRVHQDQGLPVEAGLFEEWLAQSESNALAWYAVEDAWDLFEDADDPAFAKLRQAALVNAGRPRWSSLRDHWRPVAAAAAVLVVVAGGTQLVRAPSDTGSVASQTTGTSAGQAFAAPADSPKTFALADGSRMRLEQGTRATVRFAANRRQVILERGSATFAVFHDAARPFAVAANDRTIYDIGTRFQVELKDGSMRVALFEGSVRVEGGAAVTVLRPGEQLVASPGKRDVITRISTSDTGPTGLVQFDDVTLASAAETINQGSALKLVIADPKVANLRVSGRFRIGDPERFARAAADLLSLRVVSVSTVRIELRRNR